MLDVATEGLRITCQTRVVPLAKQLAPVRTGATRDSIDLKITQTLKGPKARVAAHSGHSYYAEVGTSKESAHPFLRPAAQANLENIPGDMKEFAVGKYK